MPNFYFESCNDHSHELPKEESMHAAKSLRLTVGDEISILNGKGLKFIAEITSIEKRGISFDIVRKEEHKRKTPHLHLLVSPLKSADRFEFIIEKATELGVTSITPIECKRSFKRKLNLDRLNRIGISAIKQSGNPFLPTINGAMSFDKALDRFPEIKQYMAYCGEADKVNLNQLPLDEETAVFIGPEGDFDPIEQQKAMEKGLTMLELGSLTLRTETAAIAVCSYFELMK